MMALLLLLLMVSGLTLQTTLHLVPDKKEILHAAKDYSVKGKKKDSVDNVLYDADRKVPDQGVIIPDNKGKYDNEASKQKNGDRNIEKDFSSLLVDFRDITPTFNEQSTSPRNIKTGPESELHLKFKTKDLISRRKEAESKSLRIARLEKLARENLDEINRLKNDSLKESEEIKQETSNKSEEARLIAEIGPEVQNVSTGKHEKHLNASNDTDLINYIVSATKYNQSSVDPFVSILPSMDERLLQENDSPSETILQKTEKDGRVTTNIDKSDKDKLNEGRWEKFEKDKEMEAKVDKYEEEKAMESKVDKSKYEMQIEAKMDNPENGNHIEAKLDEDFGAKANSPEVTAINEPLFPQPKVEENNKEKNPKMVKNETEAIEAKADQSSQFNDKTLENKIIEGTMMEAEILKSKHLKPNTKIKKKKVKILILDEEDLPVKKPHVQHVYDAEDRLPVYSTNSYLNHNQNLCNLLANTNLMDTPPPVHNNCPPPHSLTPSFNNEQQLPIQHNYNVRPMDVCCPGDSVQEIHQSHRTFYPEYLRGYLRHKIRHRHTQSNVENMEDALQPQIHYHFNFMKENNGHNLGTEESLTKSSLSTDWSDRKRGSLAKASDTSNPLIDKFIAFIKSPSSDIPDPNRKHIGVTFMRNTLNKQKYTKLDGSLSNLHAAYKRSKTTEKTNKRTLLHKRPKQKSSASHAAL